MKTASFLFVVMLSIVFLSSCGVPEAPLDSNGKTPQQVLLETYLLIVDGEYERAEVNFSSKYVSDFITSKNSTFIEFHSNEQGIDTRSWQPGWLNASLVGNDYNDDVWRVGISIDAGQGNENPPGVVHDLYIIDGVWKIVFWGDYPRS